MPIEAGVVAIPLEDQGLPLTVDRGRNLSALSASNVREVSSDIRGGWRKIAPAAGGSNPSSRSMATAALQRGASFVSPVLKDTKGRDVFITQRIWVLLPSEMDAREKDKILKSINGVREITLTNPPAKRLPLPPPSPSGETTWRDHARTQDRNAIYAVDVSLRNGIDILDEIERLAKLNAVVAVEPDFIAIGESAAVTPPNDPLFDFSTSGNETAQWYLLNGYIYNGVDYDFSLDAVDTWDRGYGYSVIKVAVLDDGIQTNHPDLVVAGGKNFTGVGSESDYGPTETYANHGTAVAGLIKGTINNEIGIAGLAPNVRLYSLKIVRDIDEDGSADYVSSRHVNALKWCRDNGIRVTNSSFELSVIATSVADWYENTMSADGIVHFASTGNDGADEIAFPASASSVIAVGASSPDGTRASFSNYGTGLDFVAPGVSTQTTDRTGTDGYNAEKDYHLFGGTSAAAPLAAATAALILSKNPGLTPSQVKSALTSTARNLGSATEVGSGLIVPAAALDEVPAWIFHAAQFVDAGNGKMTQDKFGAVLNAEGFPDYYHEQHGWQNTSSTDPNNMWLWDWNSASYWWISIGDGGSYPYLWRPDVATWFYYYKGTSNPRWFLNTKTGQYVHF